MGHSLHQNKRARPNYNYIFGLHFVSSGNNVVLTEEKKNREKEDSGGKFRVLPFDNHL